MSRSRLLVLGVLLTAAGVAVVLARPEPIPQRLEPPPPPPVQPVASETTEPTMAEADPEEAPRGNALTRLALETGLLKVRARALACRDEQTPPVVPLKITIAPSGAVTGVQLPPELKGSAVGDCIVHAIRAAIFPAWSAPPELPQVEWSYPLRFDGAT